MQTIEDLLLGSIEKAVTVNGHGTTNGLTLVQVSRRTTPRLNASFQVMRDLKTLFTLRVEFNYKDFTFSIQEAAFLFADDPLANAVSDSIMESTTRRESGKVYAYKGKLEYSEGADLDSFFSALRQLAEVANSAE